MQSLEDPYWGTYAPRWPGRRLGRRLAAAILRRASALLAKAARRLVPAMRSASHEPQIEFHSEAGAPEGALYVDGKLVGWIAGIKRL